MSSSPLCWEAPSHLPKSQGHSLSQSGQADHKKPMQHSATRSLLIPRHRESCALFKGSPWRFKNPSSTDRSFKTSEKTLACLHLVREPKKPGFILLRIYSQMLSLESKFQGTQVTSFSLKNLYSLQRCTSEKAHS